MTRSINVGLLSPSNMESKGSGHDFLELLVSAAPDYRPIYYNDHEPINRSFDVSDVDKALEIWGWNFCGEALEVESPEVYGPITKYIAPFT